MLDKDTVTYLDPICCRFRVPVFPVGCCIIISRSFADDAVIKDCVFNIHNRPPESNYRIFKNDHASTVYAVPLDETQLVVKRYNPDPWVKRWRRAVRRSRARKTWDNAVRLKLIGIRTVVPVALIEHRFGPLTFRASFISLYRKGLDAQQFFESPEVSDGEKQKTAEKITATLAMMHASGIVHGDTKAKNIIVNGPQVAWLDLDAMSTRTPPGIRRIRKRKDWRLLLYNWRDLPAIQRMFVEQMGRHLGQNEVFRVLNALVRHRKVKLNSEQPASGIHGTPGCASAMSALLRCIGITAAEGDGNGTGTRLNVLLANAGDSRQRQDLLSRVGAEIGYFHGCGFLHGNLAPESLRISDAHPVRVAFLEIAGIRHFRRVSSRKIQEDVATFLRNAGRLMDDSDRMHFSLGYIQALGKCPEQDRKCWTAAIEGKVKRSGTDVE